jgi:hypothetical protein
LHNPNQTCLGSRYDPARPFISTAKEELGEGGQPSPLLFGCSDGIDERAYFVRSLVLLVDHGQPVKLAEIARSKDALDIVTFNSTIVEEESQSFHHFGDTVFTIDHIEKVIREF